MTNNLGPETTKPVITFSYTNEWGDSYTLTASLDFGSQEVTNFDEMAYAFAKFMVVAGYSVETVRERISNLI
jgi:hypothetical protein